MLPVHIIRAGTAVSEPSDASTSSFSSGGTRDTGCRRLWYIQFFPRYRESFKSRWELTRSGILQMAGGHILASSPCSRGALRVATSVVDDCHDQVRYGALQTEAGIFVEKKRSNDYAWMGHVMLTGCDKMQASIYLYPESQAWRLRLAGVGGDEESWYTLWGYRRVS